ncbi:unnamed protein product [Rotaria sp. Silwood1]|nr:unnamed protein product [Rotaria sp. Silwood1]CAF1687882.1 unnamed protein product [Rotaria sp. Silwood1]
MDSEQDKLPNKNYSLIETEKLTQSNIVPSVTTPVNTDHDNNDTLPNDKVEDNKEQEENEGEHNFDSFILENFTQFSGEQDVNVWLNDIEKKFNRLQIPRHLRFSVIPLLVEGQARKVYIKNRRHIQSFDDFYETLLSHFDKDDSLSTITHQQQNLLSQSNLNHQTKSSEEKNSPSMMTTFDNPHFPEKPPKHHSTALNDCSAATLSGESLVSHSTLVCSNSNPNTSNTSNPDDTTNVLRKVLLESLIKNPKTFQGGKDDVMQWLEDIEHLFDIAHIPDTNKLDLISYSLRGEALRWFKNNKNILTTWTPFVYEFKKAFTSAYHEELAFKKLESYTQGENQSIRNFYNEGLKLCNEADSTMSESTKLRNLLNKTKPTIQFEVRRKKPTTAKEFLEYAKETEELYQLSNHSTNTQLNTTINTNISTASTTSPSPMIPSMVNNYSNSFPNMSQPRHWNTFDNNYRINYNKNNFSSLYTSPTYNSSLQSRPSQYPSTKPHIPSQFPQKFTPQRVCPNQPQTFHNYSNTNKQTHTQQRSIISSRNNPRQNNVNSLITLDGSTQPALQQLPISIDNCTRCNQFGHQAMAGSNF